MKKCFIIDFENVGDIGLNGFFELPSVDVVYVFYSRKANRIGIEFLDKLQKASATPELVFVKVIPGNQALDKQLAMFLGYLVAENSSNMEYFIISRDKGYDCLIQFWNVYRPEIQIDRKNDIASHTSVQTQDLAPETTDIANTDVVESTPPSIPAVSTPSKPKVELSSKTLLNSQVQQALSKTNRYDNTTINAIASLVAKNFGHKTIKKDVYQSIIKQFGQKKGLELYGIVKPLLG